MSKGFYGIRALVSAAVLIGAINFAVGANTCVVDGIEYVYTVENGEAKLGSGQVWVYAVTTAPLITAIPPSTTGAITIPSSLDGYPVTSIDDNAFMWCNGLTSVTIPDSVTEIGSRAFFNCTNLIEVVLPDCVSIGGETFQECTGLVSVRTSNSGGMTTPSKSTYLGNAAFRGCTSLTSVVLPNSITNIEQVAFWGCTSLTSVAIPEGVRGIGWGAFENCSSLDSISIPDNLIYMGGMVFSGTALFENPENAWDGIVILDGWVLGVREDRYSSLCYADLSGAGELRGISGAAFYGCPYLMSVTIPNGVVSIGEDAFFRCPYLTSVTIPDTVISIGYGAFYACENLTSIVIPDSVISMGSSVFGECTNFDSVTFRGLPVGGDSFSVDAVGYYYAWCWKEWEDAIDENGKWSGLTMKMIGNPIIYEDLKGAMNTNPLMYETGDVIEFAAVTNVVGYTFAGWEPAAITEEMTGPQTVRANWVANGYTIKYDANGGEGVMEDAACVYDEGRTIASNGFRRTGYSFLGWAIERDGDVVYKEGVVVSNLLSEAGAEITLYAVWNYQSLVAESDDGAVDLAVAQVYNGCLYDSAADLVGTIQVKAAKENGGVSKITAAIQVAGEKKVTVRGVLDLDEGKMEVVAKDGRELYLVLGANGLKGSFGEYTIDGARDVFSSKASADKSAAGDVVEMLKSRGVMTIAWGGEDGWNGLSVTVGTRGRVKVAGALVGGAKVSVNAQMIMGEEWCVVPVVYSKKDVRLVFNIWIARDGSAAEVVGLGEDIVIGYGTNFEESAAFTLDSAAVLDLLGEGVYEEYLPDGPDGVEITLKGSKWILPRSGRVVLKKGEIDESKLGENPAGLRLAYRTKSGTFSGSFKVYRNVEGRVKATTVSVSGVMIDGKGYGTATVKKVGTVAVRIE